MAKNNWVKVKVGNGKVIKADYDAYRKNYIINRNKMERQGFGMQQRMLTEREFKARLQDEYQKSVEKGVKPTNLSNKIIDSQTYSYSKAQANAYVEAQHARGEVVSRKEYTELRAGDLVKKTYWEKKNEALREGKDETYATVIAKDYVSMELFGS